MADGDDVQECFPLRQLQASDYGKGYLQLLRQLTAVGDVTEEAFGERLEEIQKLGGDFQFVAVIEDVARGQIVATGTLLVERKFVRQCGKVGHIEDVVVDQCVRGRHLGQRIIDFLTNYAKLAGCYKVILDCREDNTGFYEKCGYFRKEIQMAKYF
eukprot:c20542_g1_i1 orf=127-594(+)